VWQAWGIWGILKSGTSLSMAGARLGAWQPWHSRRVAKALAGVGENHFAWQAAGAVFGEHGCTLKGSKVSFCETVVIFDFGHDGGSVWQVQHFGCLGLTFRGGRSTL